jgi:hypothetical protein
MDARGLLSSWAKSAELNCATVRWKGRGAHKVLTVGAKRVVLAGHWKELFAVGEPVTVPRRGCTRNVSDKLVATAVHKK